MVRCAVSQQLSHLKIGDCEQSMFRITFNGPSQKYNLKSAFVVRFIWAVNYHETSF